MNLAEERISELEDQSVEIFQTEIPRGKGVKKKSTCKNGGIMSKL